MKLCIFFFANLPRPYVIQTGSGANPPSYRMGIGDRFPGRKAAKGRKRGSVHPFPIRLHGVMVH